METGSAFTLLPPVKVNPECGAGGSPDLKEYKTVDFLGISTRVNSCRAQGSVLQELSSTGAFRVLLDFAGVVLVFRGSAWNFCARARQGSAR